MIKERTILNVSDNTGVKKVMCIRIIGSTGKKYAKVGDVIKVTVKESSSISKIKKGEVFNAVIIRTKSKIHRKNGFIIKFNNNSCVIINDSDNLIGTRIFGPVSRELKFTKYNKIISLASDII